MYRSALREIACLNRSLARKQKGSGNWKRAKRRLALAHSHLANKRRDSHFKLANQLLNEYDVLCFEGLSIDGMKQIWGRKVSDLAFAEFMSILESKAHQQGKKIIKIHRFDPSSQTCSPCGHGQQMPLSNRTFDCVSCDLATDREQNAARNIRSWGINSGLESVRRPKAASL